MQQAEDAILTPQEKERLRDLFHNHNNVSQELAGLKMKIGYKSREMQKLRIAKNVFCVSIMLACLTLIASSYMLGVDGKLDASIFLFARVPIMFAIFVSGWWLYSRAVEKEKILIGHGLS